MANPLPDPASQDRKEDRHEQTFEIVTEVVKTASETWKDELEFRETGVRHQPGEISLGGMVTGFLGGAVQFVAGIAHDELEFRETGHRPHHNSLEELQAKAAHDPPLRAFAHARTAEQLGLDPDPVEGTPEPEK